ncbi:MAG: hypothetical protein GX621_01490, partial [Pirellulaceae bacterium]|nr:hypothetical protein [Pirellulaceae bacterium]
LPEDVFDATVGFGIRGRLAPRLSYQGNVSVGSHGDFQDSDVLTARVRGYFSGKWEWNPTVDLMVGVAYTDLEDWPVLPVGGLVIRPNDAQILNLTFPRSSYLQRIAAIGILGRRTEYWGLIGIELEGGRWDVEMTDGSFDDLTYRDWRVVLGIEQRTLDAYKLNFEIGYVFARRLEYERSDISYTPDDTFSMTLTGRF